MSECWYNENDKHAAAWLRELAAQGHVPSGPVDERSIHDIQPGDPADTAHFFAGIGGWPYALTLAGWPTGAPVWTGSCPCQPFSGAGRGRAVDDERHLWPVWRELIRERRPATIFGEQVASGLGRRWLAGVRADLEAMGYAVGAADLCAAGVGAPHIRQRLFWVAYTSGEGLEGLTGRRLNGERWSSKQSTGDIGGLGHTNEQGPQGRNGRRNGSDQRSPWEAGMAIPCRDGTQRRAEPGIFPLAHGLPARVVRLRGYGNAIVPQVAAVFVRAFIDALRAARDGTTKEKTDD